MFSNLVILNGPFSRASLKSCPQSTPSHLTSSSPPTHQQVPHMAVLTQPKDLRSTKDKDVELNRKDVCVQHYTTKFFDDSENRMLMKSLWEYMQVHAVFPGIGNS